MPQDFIAIFYWPSPTNPGYSARGYINLQMTFFVIDNSALAKEIPKQDKLSTIRERKKQIGSIVKGDYGKTGTGD